MLRRLAVLVVAAFSIGISAAAVPAGVAASDPPDMTIMAGCGGVVDNPHFSSGANGVIVKTRYLCDEGFDMTVTGALTYLYYCGGNQPTGSQESGWTSNNGCRPVRSSNYSNFYVGPDQTVTRYTPAVGEGGATGKGWYIACTRYTRTGVTGSIRIWSNPAYVTW